MIRSTDHENLVGQAATSGVSQNERIPVMSLIVPTVLSAETKVIFAKSDKKLLKRIALARDAGDQRELRKLIDLRQKSRAAFFATASKVQKRQRMRKIESRRTTSQLALDSFNCAETREVRVFAIRKPESDGIRAVCSYDEIDSVRQLIVKESIASAHCYHESQYSIRRKSRHQALERIAQILRSGDYQYGGELDSINHFATINPSHIVERYGLGLSVRDEVITNRRKEQDNKIVLTNSIARANRALVISHATRGLPQGAASSSAIASASITATIEKFYENWKKHAALINYADNFYLFCKTRAAWEDASQDLVARFETEDCLTLRVRSPCRDLAEGLDILGLNVALLRDQPIVSVQRVRLKALTMELRRKMHELMAASQRNDLFLDQIFSEAVQLFINKVGPLGPAVHSAKWLMDFFGFQILEFGRRNSEATNDMVRLVRFLRKHYPSSEKLQANTFS